jgi:hypothetical protein
MRAAAVQHGGTARPRTVASLHCHQHLIQPAPTVTVARRIGQSASGLEQAQVKRARRLPGDRSPEVRPPLFGRAITGQLGGRSRGRREIGTIGEI